MAAERSYDAIVIGAGQGGKPLSMVLARAGLRLLSSKRGMWEEAALITVERRRKPWRQARASPILPGGHCSLQLCRYAARLIRGWDRRERTTNLVFSQEKGEADANYCRDSSIG
jgi:choline dehydrogenase-like flavoprotein